MSYNAQDWVRTLDIGDNTARHLLLELAFYLNDKTNACHPSISTLGTALCVSHNTIRSAVKLLTAKGFLEVSPYVVEGVRLGTNYRLVGYSSSNGGSKIELRGSNIEGSASKIESEGVQNLKGGGSNSEWGVVQKLNPNKEYKQVNKQGNRTSKDIAPKPKRQKQVFEKPDDVSQELFDRIVQHRKDIKKPFKSQDGVNGILKQMRLAKEQSGNSLEEIVDFWAEQEWQGFRSDWYMDILNKQKRFARNNQTTGGYHSVTYVPEIPEDVITDWTDLDEFKN